MRSTSILQKGCLESLISHPGSSPHAPGFKYQNLPHISLMRAHCWLPPSSDFRALLQIPSFSNTVLSLFFPRFPRPNSECATGPQTELHATKSKKKLTLEFYLLNIATISLLRLGINSSNLPTYFLRSVFSQRQVAIAQCITTEWIKQAWYVVRGPSASSSSSVKS